MKEQVRQIIIDNGADICGIAHISRFNDVEHDYHPCSIWSRCQSVIAFGMALPKSFFEITSRLIYGHFNERSMHKVDEVSFKSAKMIENIGGIHALPIPCDSPYEYWENDNLIGHGLLSMKQTAVFAGIGTLGKNKLLINRTYGNRLTLGVLLLDYELESDPLSEELCIRDCQLCIQVCPVNAIDENEVNQNNTSDISKQQLSRS